MRCGCREQFGDGSALMALPKNRFVYVVEDDLPGHSKDDLAGWIDESVSRWATYVDIGGERIGHINDAKDSDIVLRVTAADLGDDGVIADQQLPSRNKRIYQMRWNVRITFRPTDRAMARGTIDPLRTGTHELGHFWGSHHFPLGRPDELMEPTISDSIIGPQPTEIKLVEGWFGKAKAKPQPTPGEPSNGVWNIKGPGYELNANAQPVVKRDGVLYRLEVSPFKGS